MEITKQRNFLEFEYKSDYDAFEIRTDNNGGYVFLRNVSRKLALPRMIRHFEIVDNTEMTEDQKLSELSALWRDVSPAIGGYLFGDMSENNS